MVEKKGFPGWLKWTIIVITVALIVFVFWWLMRPKETYTSNSIDASKADALVCKIDDIDDVFFESEYAISDRHEIKAMFEEDKLSSLSYSYYGSFESNDVAKTVDATMHGKYNKYLGERSLSQNSLNPVFSVMENDTKVSLYAKNSEVTNQTAMFFFVDSDEFQRLSSRNINELKEMYEKKDFTCQITK